MSVRNTLGSLVHRAAVRSLPLKDRIILESYPLFTDNTKAVYDEMIRRGLNRRYELVWVTAQPEAVFPHVTASNVRFMRTGGGVAQRARLRYTMERAKAVIVGNVMLPKYNPRQCYINLAHGAPLKDCSRHYNLPDYADEFLSLSSYLRPYDALNMNCPVAKVKTFGFPRNDVLLSPRHDLHGIFPDRRFTKVIYWMPTYRQNCSGLALSDIAMPIIYDEAIAARISDCARQAGVLVVVKPHFAQDVARLKVMDLENLFFINDAYLAAHGILNYELLRDCDALLTDYSSVYYDYLLVDRPIGLCWDDIEQYRRQEGFIVDPDLVLSGGEKIYTPEDLCGFIRRVAAGQDVSATARRANRDLVHQYADDQSSRRVVDHIEQLLTAVGRQ